MDKKDLYVLLSKKSDDEGNAQALFRNGDLNERVKFIFQLLCTDVVAIYN